MRNLRPLQVGDGLDLLAEPAAHLRAGVAGRDIVDVVVLEEVAQQLQPAAMGHPGVHLPRVHAERDRAVEGEGRVLADEVIAGGVAHLDGVVLHRVEHLKGRERSRPRRRRGSGTCCRWPRRRAWQGIRRHRKSVSRLFGQLAASRHLISGWRLGDCRSGASRWRPAPTPPAVMNERRFIWLSSGLARLYIAVGGSGARKDDGHNLGEGGPIWTSDSTEECGDHRRQQGLGLAMAEKFCRRRVPMWRSSRAAPRPSPRPSSRIQAGAKGKVATVSADVSKAADIRRAYDAVMSELGKIDILVNNAGPIDPRSLGGIDRRDVAKRSRPQALRPDPPRAGSSSRR